MTIFIGNLDNVNHNNIIEPSVNPTSRNMPWGHNPIWIIRVKQLIYKAVARMRQAEELASLSFWFSFENGLSWHTHCSRKDLVYLYNLVYQWDHCPYCPLILCQSKYFFWLLRWFISMLKELRLLCIRFLIKHYFFVTTITCTETCAETTWYFCSALNLT